jgi:hypothetical protein
LIGRQAELDSGSFLERYAMPGGAMWQAAGGQPPEENLSEGLDKRLTALKSAYAKYRATFQRAYENHVNWEFTEEELIEIDAFLERPVGRHFLEGRWRMDAYVGSDTEALEQQIVKDALASLSQ